MLNNFRPWLLWGFLLLQIAIPSQAWSFASLAQGSQPTTEAQLSCLLTAYPEFLVGVTPDGVLISHRGDRFALTEQKGEEKTLEERLVHADLKDQLSIPYPRETLIQAPAPGQDPGRFRAQAFFQKMYGASPEEVRQNLRQVYWAPCRCYIPFTKVNDAAQALEEVGRILSLQPELAAYMTRTLGTYHWRKISRLPVLSMHAFGAAIDFDLPDNLGRYWQWSGCRSGQPCHYPPELLRDDRLNAIVQIFEAKGFIWGGKWSHYDSLHFEFRPELAGPRCDPRDQ